MSVVKSVLKWLKVAGIEQPEQPQMPSSEQHTLLVRLIMEELLENVASANVHHQRDLGIALLDMVIEHLAKTGLTNVLTIGRYIKGSKDKKQLLLSASQQAYPHDARTYDNKFTEYRDSLADLQVVVSNGYYFAGMTADQAKADTDEVMRSNFSKFLTSLEEALTAVTKIQERTGETVFHIKQVGDIFVIKDSNQKIRKPLSYTPPKLKKL